MMTVSMRAKLEEAAGVDFEACGVSVWVEGGEPWPVS